MWSDGVEESAEPGEVKGREGDKGCKEGDKEPECALDSAGAA